MRLCKMRSTRSACEAWLGKRKLAKIISSWLSSIFSG